jgi:uncharacterized protein YcnI
MTPASRFIRIIMHSPFTLKFIALYAGLITVTSAFSHVTLEQSQVETGAHYKAVLRVGHGCEGLPTTALRVQLPAGFQGAKPMPKHGWTVQSTVTKLTAPYDNHGKQITEGVTEITWTAQSPAAALPDSYYVNSSCADAPPCPLAPLGSKSPSFAKMVETLAAMRGQRFPHKVQTRAA